MKDNTFERELKVLINYVRAYGIEHMSKKYDMKTYMENKEIQREFTENVHKGFYLAQRNCVLLLKKILYEKKQYKSELKEARRNKNKEKCNEIEDLIKHVTYQELVLRKVMDSIAWQIFGTDLSILRRLYYGQELIDITDSNLESELRFVEKIIKEDSACFVLISDITSFIQIGDVVIFSPDKGVAIGELKEGETNAKVFELIQESIENTCPYFLFQRLDSENEKFKKQFKRDIKQIVRTNEALKIINEGEGEDLLTGANVKRYNDEIVLGTYENIIRDLIHECDKKNYAISVVEECLLIGVYKSDKFSSNAFDVWARSLNIKMPVIDFRQSFFDPLGFPIFLQPFPDNYITDIVMGRKIIKLTIDIDKWLKNFTQYGCTYRWISKKETSRINSKLKGKAKIFALDGCGVEIVNKDGMKQHLGEGIFSRMFTGLNTPSSLRNYLLTTMEYLKE